MTALGILLIITPVILAAASLLLGMRFGYPAILREPTAVILERFRAGGTPLILLWWVFTLSALLFLPIAALGAWAIDDPNLAIPSLAVGIAAGLVQALGLVRWVFLVPSLARAEAEGHDPRTVDLVFQSFHRLFGVAVGEHFGYLLTGVWTILFSVGATALLPVWMTVAGILIGAALVVGSFEFVGPFERAGWRIAGVLVPVAYTLWSIWLVVAGILTLLVY